MDPESKKLLEDTYALTEENNKMLHSIKRSMFLARIMSILYWLMIIGVSVGAFYFIQPYIDQLMGVYGKASGVINSFPSFPN